MQLKRENPDVNDASVLMERQVKYDYLIQVMDAIRSAKVAGDGGSAADSAGADSARSCSRTSPWEKPHELCSTVPGPARTRS